MALDALPPLDANPRKAGAIVFANALSAGVKPLRAETMRMDGYRKAERQLLKQAMIEEEDRRDGRLFAHYRERDRRWQTKLVKNPLGADLLAESNKVDAANRRRARKEQQMKAQAADAVEQQRYRESLREAVASAYDPFAELRAEKRRLLEEDQQLRALKDVERRKKNFTGQITRSCKGLILKQRAKEDRMEIAAKFAAAEARNSEPPLLGSNSAPALRSGTDTDALLSLETLLHQTNLKRDALAEECVGADFLSMFDVQSSLVDVSPSRLLSPHHRMNTTASSFARAVSRQDTASRHRRAALCDDDSTILPEHSVTQSLRYPYDSPPVVKEHDAQEDWRPLSREDDILSPMSATMVSGILLAATDLTAMERDPTLEERPATVDAESVEVDFSPDFTPCSSLYSQRSSSSLRRHGS